MRQMKVFRGAVFALCAGAVGPWGCSNLGLLNGSAPGGGGNQNTGVDPSPGGTTGLTAITFSPASGFPQGQDPAEFDVGGGSITAKGGEAGTLGLTGLYADDSFAWDFLAGAQGSITFNDLEVIAVDGYWVHPNSQSAGATMTVNFTGGSTLTVASVPVNGFGTTGQAAGFFATVTAPQGESIASLTFDFDTGAGDGNVATLDVLELTVAQ